MQEVFSAIERVNNKINGAVWGPVMLVVLVGIGLYFSVRIKFIQATRFGTVLKETVGSLFGKKSAKRGQREGITPFQALSTALAGTIGVGNIVGVATAIALGGAGSIFWMWISAIFGMATKYAEIVLAVRFREKDANGQYVGGPMYYIKKGLKSPFLAACFALFGVTASFGIGNLTQVNAISSSLHETFNIHPAVTGVIIAALVGIVIIGGVKRVASVSEKIVPFMVILYFIGALTVIYANRHALPGAIGEIFSSAFGLGSIAGGLTGAAIAKTVRLGVARGVFSNEAGMGSSSIIHACADTDNAVRQGLWGVFEVFVDTIVGCSLTAFAILSTDFWKDGSLNGTALTSKVFVSILGDVGGYFLAISILLFAFATIVGWSYYGESCGRYLFGDKFLIYYKIIYVFFVAIGAVMELNLVWELSDTLNGLMAIPNLIALIGLSGIVIKLTKEQKHPGGILSRQSNKRKNFIK